MYIYGKNVVLEALKNSNEVKKIYLYSGFNDREALSEIERSNVDIKYVRKDELNKMVNGNHQGVVANVKDYDYADIEDMLVDDALIVILDHLEDPHNFGAIIRTCEAAGVDGIIIPKDRSVSVNPTVIKVSTGAIENVKIAMVININKTIEDLKKKGFWIVGTDMVGTDYTEIDYKGNIAIVIGNEGSGMSRLTHDACDFIASIKMNGTTNSLNASVATGIVVFEAIKSRRNNGL